MLTGGALLHARTIADGMVVDPARMKRNLDVTHGGIMAEAIMMGLAPKLGRETAHHAVKHATDAATANGTDLVTALLDEPEVAANMDAGEIKQLADPASYLGAADQFIDRVLARAATLTA